MKDARRIAAVACVMLVTLRLMIGWQLLYEGMWKIKTLNSPRPWTAAGYLKNSQGPFRDMFREMAGDADDLDWLNVKKVSARWDDWHKRFAKHYRLDKRQKSNLNRWINGPKDFKAEIPAAPEGYNDDVFEFVLESEAKEPIDFTGADSKGNALSYEAGQVKVFIDGRRFKGIEATDGSKVTVTPDPKKPIKKGAKIEIHSGNKLMNLGLDEVVSFLAGEKSYVVVDGKRHLTTAEREKLTKALEADGHGDLVEPVQKAYKRSKDGISFKEKLAATIRGNPDLVTKREDQRIGKIEEYKSLLADYERDLSTANSDYRWDHLQFKSTKIRELRSSLVGPVKALEKEMMDKAEGQLSMKQMRRGPVGEPWTALRISDYLTIAGLTLLGACLILGLLTRFSALMAAVMLFMFYAAMPPWPGVPEVPGPEHSFIVNKNFIEVIALIAIACLPTGIWFGVDGMIGRWRGKRKLARLEAEA